MSYDFQAVIALLIAMVSLICQQIAMGRRLTRLEARVKKLEESYPPISHTME